MLLKLIAPYNLFVIILIRSSQINGVESLLNVIFNARQAKLDDVCDPFGLISQQLRMLCPDGMTNVYKKHIHKSYISA